jgi:hypothetical protein
MGPPDTNTVGMFRRRDAMSMPGVILSQLEMHTRASAQWALHMYSTESAIRSRLGREYSMPPWPMAMPSSTAMVLNSLATPPAASISRATSWPMSFRCTWPGTNWVKELAMAMMGLSKSASFMPVARHRARAPAMLRPWVVVRERYWGMVGSVDQLGHPDWGENRHSTKRRASAPRARLHRQATPDPARSGAAAGHAFADVVDVGETLILQDRLHLAGAVAGAADQGDGRVPVAAHPRQHRVGERRMAHVDARGPLRHAGLAPFLGAADIHDGQVAGPGPFQGFGRAQAGHAVACTGGGKGQGEEQSPG